MNYLDFLNNELVIDQYNKIDEINPYPFNHGLKHVKNVCKIMAYLCDTLGIDREEKEALLIASAMHDIGQVGGREEHGRKAKDFLINNFNDGIKNNKFYNNILEAIENHDNPCAVEYPLFTVLLQFCDKMDFSKERLEDNYKEKFGYVCYEDIEKIDFIYDMEKFGINLITNGNEIFIDSFIKEPFTKKILNAVEVIAEKLNRKPLLLIDGNNLNII